MAKSKKNANWGCVGLGFIIFSFVILGIYLTTGGLPSGRSGKIMKGEYAGSCAFLMSGFFFISGLLSFGVWLLRKTTRKDAQNRHRWQQPK